MQLDCATTGAVTTHPVHLHIGSSPAADMPAPMTSIPAPKGSRVLPALTDESARQLSDQEIVALGYSPRPDPAESPEAYTPGWLETYSRPITMLPPQSVRQSAIRHTLPSVEAGFFSSANWSGYVAQSVPRQLYSGERLVACSQQREPRVTSHQPTIELLGRARWLWPKGSGPGRNGTSYR